MAFSDASPLQNSMSAGSYDENAHPDKLGSYTNLDTHSICNGKLGSYNDVYHGTYIHMGAVKERGYVPKEQNLQYVASMPESFGKQLKAARYHSKLSMSALAKAVGISARRLQHIELGEVEYDKLSPELLEAFAVALDLSPGTFMDSYHTFIKEGYADRVRAWLAEHYTSYAEAQRKLDVGEYALFSWRTGRNPPPRWFYKLIIT